MKIRKELWFGFILMALIIAGTAGVMLSAETITNGHYGLMMLALVVVAIMLGFPTAFTLMGMGMLFAYFAYHSGGQTRAGAVTQTLDLMVQRGVSREAFGRKLAWLGGNVEHISRARIDIEAMRLMVLKAAKAMDVLGNREARIWVHMVKAMVPERVCQIIDQAIQMHGALGVSQHTPLARMYAMQRTLRLADGPDEVHHLVVGRQEIGHHQSLGDELNSAMVWRN